MSRKPKILLFDIEATPCSGYHWSLWGQNISYDKQLIGDWYMMSYAAKWLDKKTIMYDALPNHKDEYETDPENDFEITKSLWHLLDEADIVIAHNGDGFDIKKVQERFLAHGFPPPSPFKSIDTLSGARRHFKFTSNKLDSIATRIGLKNKLTHEGFELWKKCIHGNKKAWRTMREYNKQDIRVLEEVYLHIRPWLSTHPSLAVYTPDKKTCPTCGGGDLTKQDKDYYTNSLSYGMHKCNDCHAFSRERTHVNSKGAKLPLRGVNRK